MEAIANQNTLLIEETLRFANEAFGKRQRVKKIRVCHRGVLTGEVVSDLLAQNEIGEHLARDIRRNREHIVTTASPSIFTRMPGQSRSIWTMWSWVV